MKKLLFLSTALPLWLTAWPAHAEPVTIALFGAAFAATTAGAIVSFGFSLAFTYGVSLLQKALMKPKGAKPAGVEVDVKMGDDQPIRFCLGTFATAGVRKYMNTFGQFGGTPNAYLVDVIELSNVPIPGIDAVWVNDKKVTPQWNNPNADGFIPFDEYHGDNGEDYLLMKIYDGTQTAADPFLVSKFGSDPDHPWTSEMIGRGCAYAVMIARYDQSAWNGAPTFLFEPKPLALYDIRKDSTNGGSGTHRWGQPETYESSNNPVVMIYNIIRGIYYGDEWIFGGQNLAAIRLPPSSWMAAANECDVLVDLAEGGTEKQFRAGIEVTGDMEPLDVIDEIRKSCNARIAEVGGVFKILVGAPGAAVYSFTDDDIVVTSEQSFDPFPTLDETVNGVEGTYPEPEEKWATNDAPPRYDEDLEAEDGGRRLVSSVQFAAAPFAIQVQRLMTAMMNDQRRFRIHQFYLPPDAYRLEPNDVVAWTSNRNGYVNKKFVITDITGEATFLQLVTLHEIDPSDYDWVPGQQLPTVISPTGPIITTPQPTYGFTAVPWTILDSQNNARRPTIKVITASGQDDVERIWIQVKLKSSGEVIFDNSGIPYGSPYEWILNGTFLPSTTYEVRGKFIPITNRETLWSDWVDVMTPGVFIGTVDVLNDAITAEKIADAAVTAAKIMDETITALKLADQAVTTAKLEIGAVTQQILAAGSITLEKFVPGLEPITTVTGSMPTTKLTSIIAFEGEVYTWDEATSAYVKPATGIEDGSVTANKLADAAVIASKLANGAVTHDKISAGSIYGDVIAAQAITARELFLTDFENRLPNGGFEEGGSVFTYWTSVNGPGALLYLSKASYPSEVQTGERSLVLQKNADSLSSSINVASVSYIPVTVGTTLFVSTVLKGNDGTSASGAYVRILWYNNAKIQLVATPYTDAVQNVPITAAWVGYAVKVAVPADAAFMRVQLINSSSNTTARNLIFDRVHIRLANAANLIVDGGIVANHLAVDSVTADKILASSVTSAKIAAAAITAEKMAIGLGRNLLGNTELFGGYTGWETWNQAGIANRQITLRPETDTWSLKSQPYTWSFEQLDANATVGVLQSAHTRYIPVIAGGRYELFAFLGTHRCQGYVGCSFLDHTGAYITEFNSATINNNGGGGKIITNYAKVGIFVTAPANAAVAVFYMRKLPTQSGGDSYMFAVRPYFGEAGPNQNVLSDWTPGGVTYIGSDYLLTGSVIASKIGALAVTAEKIAAGAITADKIAASSITGDKIAANTIGAVNIAAQAIIASKLIITDFSNMADNGFDVGDFSSWNWGGSPIQYYKEGAGSPVSTAYVAATQSDWIAVSKRSACKEGDAFMLEAWVYNSDLTSSGISIYAAGDDGNGVWKTFSLAATTALKGQWVKLQGRAVIPAGYGVQRVAFLVAKGTAGGWGYFSKPVMRRATNAEMIVDGSITADKLNVNSLTAISANFGNATVTGYIQSANGKMQLDFNNGYIIINS